MKGLVLLMACIAVSLSVFSQNGGTNYQSVDDKVQQLGALTTFNVATIADTITAPFADLEKKARAIFYWIANNISLDPKATRQNDPKNTVPEKVIELRKASPLGFSLLVQEMCSAANIRCISVDGYVKRDAEEINQPIDEVNASWNVIQLGQSPETWYFADAARASGFLDKKMAVFTKQFNSAFFFADRKLFNLAGFPDNPSWQLGGGPKSKKDYYALPVISNYAFEAGLNKPAPATGLIKTSTKKPVNFSFNAAKEIKSITLVTGEAKRQSKPEEMNFENNGGTISFTYQFKKEDDFQLRIFADGKELLQYMVEVVE